MPVRINSVDCIVIVFGAFVRNFLAVDKSSSQEIITTFSGHLVGGRNKVLPPQHVTISIMIHIITGSLDIFHTMM